MRIFGIVCLVGLVFGGVLYITGNIRGSADIQLTEQGKSNLDHGINTAKEGINKGLDSLKVDK